MGEYADYFLMNKSISWDSFLFYDTYVFLSMDKEIENMQKMPKKYFCSNYYISSGQEKNGMLYFKTVSNSLTKSN